jgi:UTP-glucose-1-phosphate uridylyltransferase/galactokinase
MKLFVPGRICLFGEHTDWAGGYRRINGKLEKGYAIISGTNQGLYADVKPHPDKLIIQATLNKGEKFGPFEVPMEREALLKEASSGGFLSYAAGVAYQILTHYRVRGLEIDNYLTDLPVQKGLSSSAAICVLVARAFNRLYDLKMTVRGEMELAYLGEITTPSRCGRLDQGCAYGNRPVMMTFDGDRLDVREVNVPKTLHYVVVDLKAHKDTVEILSKLNRCYPFAEDEVQRRVQAFLGPVSADLTHRAMEAIADGDVEMLGRLMTEAQAAFDAHLQPACPDQLTAPVLHKLLSYEPIQPYLLGGKGVGSQGDGTAQLLVADEAAQDAVIALIEGGLQMSCMKMSIQSAQRIRKAVIPAAGFGTRLFPATKSMKKEMFPVIDRDGRAKPVIMATIEQAVRAGVEEFALIIQAGDRALFEDFFHQNLPIGQVNKLSTEDREYLQTMLEIGRRVTLIVQEEQKGFGHAVHCAKEWVDGEPFFLMLGDHLYTTDSDEPCAEQLLKLYQRTGKSVVGLEETAAEEVHHFGCVTGVWDETDDLLSITEFAEKPDLEYARAHLQTPGMKEDHFLTVFGQYILTPQIFDLLEEHIHQGGKECGDIGLTPCLDRLRQDQGFMGCRINGKRFDIGIPEAYRRAVLDHQRTSPPLFL